MTVPNTFVPGTLISAAQVNQNFDAVVPTATLAASSGAAGVGFIQVGTGAVTRTSQSKMRDVVSVEDFGAVGDGVTDDTAAIQAAIDSGATAVFFPAGRYRVRSLVMPNVFSFVLFGVGPASMLVQIGTATDAAIVWARDTIRYNSQTIRDIGVDATGATQHSIDTRGSGGCTFDNLYFEDVAVGKAAIYSEGLSGTYDHDARFTNIQVYYRSLNGGAAGIWLGPLSADTQISNFVMNGAFQIDYCLLLDSGAASCIVDGSHPYNAKLNVVRLAGNDGISFTGCTFDNAIQDIVTINNSSNVRFTGCRIQAVKSSYTGVKITGAGVGYTLINTMFSGSSGALSCVSSEVNCNNVLVFGGAIPNSGNFTTRFDLLGSGSSARGLAGNSPLGLLFSQVGVQSAAQAQNTTQYLGVGSSTSEGNAVYCVPQDAALTLVQIAVSATPAVGQTFTFQARKNGANIGSPIVISNGQFSGSLTFLTAFSKFTDRLTISSVFSATSGSSTVRWSADFQA